VGLAGARGARARQRGEHRRARPGSLSLGCGRAALRARVARPRHAPAALAPAVRCAALAVGMDHDHNHGAGSEHELAIERQLDSVVVTNLFAEQPPYLNSFFRFQLGSNTFDGSQSPAAPLCPCAPGARPPPRPTRRGAQRGKRERAERAGQPGAPPARTRHAWLAGALCDRAARNRTAQATNLQWRRGSGWRPWGQRPSTRTPVGTAWYRGPGCVAETICAAVAAPRGRASPVQLAPQAIIHILLIVSAYCICICI